MGGRWAVAVGRGRWELPLSSLGGGSGGVLLTLGARLVGWPGRGMSSPFSSSPSCFLVLFLLLLFSRNPEP